jgi:hypothetical protein
MSALPALTRAYFTRGNQAFSLTDTRDHIEAIYTWYLAMNLLDLSVAGTTGGTRVAASVWICRGSSNGTTYNTITSPGVAGVNHWSSTFNAAEFVRGSNVVSHSWMLLENVGLGYELLINYSTTVGCLCVSIAPSGWFAGGTLAQFPVCSPTSRSVQLRQTAYAAGGGGEYSLFGDTITFGGVNYFHFTTSATGEFHVAMSRVGTSCLTNWFALWRSVGQITVDTLNTFLLCSLSAGTATGRGSPSAASIAAPAFCASLQYGNVQKNSGGVGTLYSSIQQIMDYGVNTITGEYETMSCDIVEVSPVCYRRGALPDIYMIGTATVGGSIPSTVAQERTIMGQLVLPMTLVIPTL